MKIAITGTHKTGKTTLAESLYSSLPHFELIEEPYIQLESKGHLFTEIPSVDDYISQFDLSIEQIAKDSKNVIYDRCPIDLLAYIQSPNELNLEFLYQEVKREIKNIDLLVFVSIEEPDLIESFDLDLSELRQQVNDILHEIIWSFDVNIIEVLGSVEARKNQVLEKLDLHL